MAETYCGKSCTQCDSKQHQDCPGCRVGPGRKYGGSCNIAQCCVSKQHQSCEQCVNASTCPTLRNRHGAPATRARTEEKDAFAMRRRYDAASVLGRWLTMMFWVCIGSNAVELVFLFMGLQVDTTLIKSICSIVIQVLNTFVLFKLAAASDRFRLSAIMTIAGCAITLVGTMIDHPFLALILLLGSLVIVMVSEYQQFMGFVEVTEEVDSELSNKWSNLWTAYLICLCITLAGALFTAMGIALAALITLSAAIGLIVAGVFKIVYLYRTGVFFRNLSSELQYWYLMS